jgi:membrane-associated phospholipid phosphatase
MADRLACSPGVSSRLLLALAVACAAAFAVLAIVVMPAGHPVNLDVAVLDWVVAHRSEPVTAGFVAVAWSGSILALMPLTALVAWALRRVAPVVWLAITAVGANVLHYVFTLIFARPRPSLGPRLYEEATWSFPSGHATQAIAVAAIVFVLAREGRSRGWLLAGAVAYTLLVGSSRIYLGAHWTTDVLAGFALGGAWVALVVVARRARGG